jgi:hypothetical protein
MRPLPALLLHLPLACTVALSSQASVADSTTSHSRFAGVYLSRLAPPLMNLSLGKDGTATVTEDPGTGATTLFGHWVDSGSQVTVTFDAVEGRPVEPPMIFQPAHDGLQAVTWNHACWGKGNPPPMKKGYKVKQLYWTTTGP